MLDVIIKEACTVNSGDRPHCSRTTQMPEQADLSDFKRFASWRSYHPHIFHRVMAPRSRDHSPLVHFMAGLDRVAIVDFDVHHGNGTESIFQSEQHVGGTRGFRT